MKKVIILTLVMALSVFLAAPSSVFATSTPASCTPGYWKQSQHFYNWPTAEELCPNDAEAIGYDPTMCPYSSVFGVSPSFGDKTFLEVLWQGGGGENAMGRHAAAAMLNAYARIQPGSTFGYPLLPSEVWWHVNNAYDIGTKSAFTSAKGLFEGYNESLVCPLN